MSWIKSVVKFFGGGQSDAILACVLVCLGLLLLSFVGKLAVTLVRVVRFVRGRGLARKAYRATLGRRVQYTLPERDNSYVRARLHTALQVEEIKEEENAIQLRLDYVNQMLTKLREASLSPVERLDVEEMGATVSLYLKKEKWSASDIKAINEIFARLLKLAARYEIAV